MLHKAKASDFEQSEKLIYYLRVIELGWCEMATSAEGIVEKAELFFGVARRTDSIEIILMADAYGPISNAKCKITFKDGQITEVKSDGGGILMFHRKAQGDFTITVMEAKKTP